MKQALGMIETKGLVALIEASDAMLKSARVTFTGWVTVGSGLVTAFVEGDVYANLLGSMRRPLIAVFYIVAMAALALHLYHGAWSSLRTLGVAQASVSPLKRRAAVIIAIAIAAGFAVVPLAVLLGVVK